MVVTGNEVLLPVVKGNDVVDSYFLIGRPEATSKRLRLDRRVFWSS